MTKNDLPLLTFQPFWLKQRLLIEFYLEILITKVFLLWIIIYYFMLYNVQLISRNSLNDIFNLILIAFILHKNLFL